MEKLNRNMENEAVMARIITAVTLLYLPATFVSVSSWTAELKIYDILTGSKTFFSTDIIKYQDPNGGSPGNGVYSSLAMKRWLEVTLPLTAVTLLGAYLAKTIADRSRHSRDTNLKQNHPVIVSGSSKPVLPLHNWAKSIQT